MNEAAADDFTPISGAMRVRTKRAVTRRRWVDSLEAAVWLTAAAAIALFVAGGGLLGLMTAWDYGYALGRMVGLVAAVLILTQVLLISRAPWVERALGHDRAAAIHTRLGKVAFVLMLVHFALITTVTAYYDGNSVFAQPLAFTELGWYMAAALAGLAVFTVVVATSLVIIRSRWRYENWHAVHLLNYVAIGLVIPHQFLEGSTFRNGGLAWWFWLVLYVFALGSLLVFRVARPLANLFRHDLRVSEVEQLPDGSASITMTGRSLERLRSQPGQFFLWRFLDRERWNQAHPFSLSRQPKDNTLRITVKPSGDHTRSIAAVAPGTRVLAEGPLGVFSEATRTRPSLVLVAAGIGITPIRALLEEHDRDTGPCTVIVRARSEAEAPLIDEVRQLAAERGAALHELYGPRGDGWAPADNPTVLSELVPYVSACDVYICGPESWAQEVQADAKASGCDPESIHRETFAW